MRFAILFTILATTFSCKDDRKDYPIIGNWAEISETKLLDGIEVTIPVDLLNENSNCKYYIFFKSESELVLGNCKQSFKEPDPLLFVQQKTKYNYRIIDSILLFDNRKFEIKAIESSELTLVENINGYEIIRKYKREN